MLNRTGARNVSCSVVRIHRIRNGFSTSLGSNVVPINHHAASLGQLSSWYCRDRTNSPSKELQSESSVRKGFTYASAR